jgi:hydrogenase expression/formation protein HypC
VGDWILVHVGYAIQTVTEREAKESWELFDQMLIDS